MVKNDQSSTENEINILLLGGALISLVHYMYPYKEKKNKTNPQMIFWITKKDYRINSQIWITEANIPTCQRILVHVLWPIYLNYTFLKKYLALLVKWNSACDVWNEKVSILFKYNWYSNIWLISSPY